MLWPFNHYPGTDYETFNWDWLIKTVKTYTAKVDEFTEDMTDAWNTFKNLINHEIAEMHRKFAIYVNVTEEALNTGAIATGAITFPKLATALRIAVTPEMYGATGDGVTDDTQAIQAAIDAGRNIIFLSNTYKISIGEDGYALKIPSNRNIFMNNSTLTLASNDLDTYQIMLIENDSNIIIEKGVITGDSENHVYSDTSAEWGHCIHLAGAKNVHITDVECKNAIGDGIYMHSGCKNIYIDNVRTDRTGRNGITVAGANPCYINNTTVNDAYRVSPKTGIDIEPNTVNDTCVVFINNLTSTNNGASIQIGNITGAVEDVQCSNIRGDRRFVVNNPNENSKLNVSVNGMVLDGSDQVLLYLCNQADDSQIYIDNVKLKNSYEDSRDIMYFSNESDNDNRNIHLTNITLVSSDCYIPISTSQDRSHPGMHNCDFKGALLSAWSYNGDAHIKNLKMRRTNKNKMSVSASDTGSYNYQYNVIENTATTNRYFYYDHANAPDSYEITIINNGTGNFLFRTNTGSDFVLNGVIGYQYGMPPGSSMKITYHASTNKWIASDVIGEVYIV